jgi:lysophospholipase L1-like esterase
MLLLLLVWRGTIVPLYPYYHDPQTPPSEDDYSLAALLATVLDPDYGLPPACDPRRPVDRPDAPRWSDLHRAMVQKASDATVATHNKIHTLFLGDSLTERWHGTQSLGKVAVPEIAAIFRQHFGPTALALGAGGDTTMNLHYHLQHGWLPPTLRPRCIVLLIGTNNLGRLGCDATATLAGILVLVRYLRLQRPRARIVLHALLPRNEDFGVGNYTLGNLWQHIQWINQQLRQYCRRPATATTTTMTSLLFRPTTAIPECYFVDHGDLFLTHAPLSKNATTATTTATRIDPGLMEDALHPTVRGYQRWAPRLAEDIARIVGS